MMGIAICKEDHMIKSQFGRSTAAHAFVEPGRSEPFLRIASNDHPILDVSLFGNLIHHTPRSKLG